MFVVVKFREADVIHTAGLSPDTAEIVKAISDYANQNLLGETTTRITAASREYPLWEFAVIKGRLEGTENAVAGYLNERTLAFRPAENNGELPFWAGQLPRSWRYDMVNEPLTSGEAAERTENLRNIAVPAGLADDLRDYDNGVLNAAALWAIGIANGWISAEEPSGVILVHRQSDSPNQWRFYVDYARPRSPPGGNWGGITVGGEINLRTLEITPVLTD